VLRGVSPAQFEQDDLSIPVVNTLPLFSSEITLTQSVLPGFMSNMHEIALGNIK